MKYYLAFLFGAYIAVANAQAPQMMLLESYKSQNVQGWVMSEKLDGVRGYWNGDKLYSRQGMQLSPPSYFTQDFPPFAIDGEIFSQRNEFEKISSIVRSQQDKGWSQLKLYVFDVPSADGNLFERLAQLKQYLKDHPTPYIEIIEQIPIKSWQQVQEKLREVERGGGEGLVLRNPNSPYETKRSNQILKLKTAQDEECTVIAHHQGKGQFENFFGSLTCENHRGQFKIGSGFNLNDRANPPPIGSTITYKYRGLTKSGKPKFATYWRERSSP